MNELSISYKCQNSIGNSLKLDEMISETLETFIDETQATYASFYLLDNNDKKNIASLGNTIDYDVNNLLQKTNEKKINIYKYDEVFNLLLYKLEKGLMVCSYKKDSDFSFLETIHESLRKKLNVSINSCVNIMNLENENKKLSNKASQLEKKIKKEKDLNKKKDKQIFEQMKMAQMGDLIGNIAHQWRQPLSIISTAASGMKIKQEHDMLSSEDFCSYANKIVENTQFLSTTIDEFRDYIQESHKEKDVIIQDRVKMALQIIEPSFDVNEIKIIEGHIEEESISFRLISGELLQVLISILNNAKDALCENDIKNKWVKYSVVKDERKIIITIEDNAGGIPQEIKNKIFNPYFTTKDKSVGTGIGLYNCFNIVTKSLKGNLSFANTENGTKFIIELPIYDIATN